MNLFHYYKWPTNEAFWRYVKYVSLAVCRSTVESYLSRQRDIFLELLVNRDGLKASAKRGRESLNEGERDSFLECDSSRTEYTIPCALYSVASRVSVLCGLELKVTTYVYTGIIRRRLYVIGKRRVKKNAGICK